MAVRLTSDDTRNSSPAPATPPAGWPLLPLTFPLACSGAQALLDHRAQVIMYTLLMADRSAAPRPFPYPDHPFFIFACQLSCPRLAPRLSLLASAHDAR